MHTRLRNTLGSLLYLLLCSAAGARCGWGQGSSSSAASPNRMPAVARIAPSTSPYVRHLRTDPSQHEIDFYQTRWGVDELAVKTAESGQMVRFSYRVTDPVRSAPLNDKTITPYLIDDTAHVKLEVPIMEKVGQLRQINTPEVGKSYWMVFSNKGNVVKPGDRVNIIVGKFQVSGLYVR